MKNIAIILAGGSGHRTGLNIPKQFWIVAGKTILEHTIQKFEQHPRIDEVSVVINPAYIEEAKNIVDKNSFGKIKHLIPGGKERHQSTLAALDIYKNTDCKILIHDAVRPLVSDRIIDEVIDTLEEFRAVNIAIPSTDTIIEVDTTHTYIENIPDRSLLYQVQTPQGFRIGTLKDAFTKALVDENFIPTDDCSVVKKYLPDEKIKIIQGDKKNIKITFMEDIYLFELLIKEK